MNNNTVAVILMAEEAYSLSDRCSGRGRLSISSHWVV